MYELNDLNPDVMRAELAYRRQWIQTEHRPGWTGRIRWTRARRRPARAHHS